MIEYVVGSLFAVALIYAFCAMLYGISAAHNKLGDVARKHKR